MMCYALKYKEEARQMDKDTINLLIVSNGATATVLIGIFTAIITAMK